MLIKQATSSAISKNPLPPSLLPTPRARRLSSLSLFLLAALFLLLRLLLLRRGLLVAAAGRALVDRLADLHDRLLQLVDLLPDLLQVLRLDRGAQVPLRLLDAVLHLRGDFVPVLREVLVRAVNQRVRLVLRFDELLPLLVRVRVRLGVADHLLDLRVGQTAGGLDRDLLLLVRRLVARADVHDAVRVDVERDLDLGGPSRRGGDAHEVKVPEDLVVRGHLALALQNLDPDLGLVVRRGGKRLRLFRRNRRVAVDETREDAAEGLDPERQRRDVEEEDILDVTAEDAALDRRAHGDDLVRVHALVRLLPGEEVLDNLVHLRHARHPADEKNFVDLARGDARVLEARPARVLRPVEKRLHELLELRARHGHRHVLRP
eukprot:31314-Pelagococcus_subviridis.AAC.15